jgi:hypothetical protein
MSAFRRGCRASGRTSVGEIASDLLLPVPSSIGARLRIAEAGEGRAGQGEPGPASKARSTIATSPPRNRPSTTSCTSGSRRSTPKSSGTSASSTSDRRTLTDTSSGAMRRCPARSRTSANSSRRSRARARRHRRAVPAAATWCRSCTAYSAASGMSVGVPVRRRVSGPQGLDDRLLTRRAPRRSSCRAARSIDIGGDFDGLEYPYIDESSRVDGSRWGGVQVYRNAEAATVTAKQPKIGKGELRLEEITGLATPPAAAARRDGAQRPPRRRVLVGIRVQDRQRNHPRHRFRPVPRHPEFAGARHAGGGRRRRRRPSTSTTSSRCMRACRRG